MCANNLIFNYSLFSGKTDYFFRRNFIRCCFNDSSVLSIIQKDSIILLTNAFVNAYNKANLKSLFLGVIVMFFILALVVVFLIEIYSIIKLFNTNKVQAKSTWYLGYTEQLSKNNPQLYAQNLLYTKIIMVLRSMFAISIGLFLGGIYVYESHSDDLLLIISIALFSVISLIVFIVSRIQSKPMLRDVENYTKDNIELSSANSVEISKVENQFKSVPNLWLLEFIFGIIALVFVLIFW